MASSGQTFCTFSKMNVCLFVILTTACSMCSSTVIRRQTTDKTSTADIPISTVINQLGSNCSYPPKGSIYDQVDKDPKSLGLCNVTKKKDSTLIEYDCCQLIMNFTKDICSTTEKSFDVAGFNSVSSLKGEEFCKRVTQINGLKANKISVETIPELISSIVASTRMCLYLCDDKEALCAITIFGFLSSQQNLVSHKSTQHANSQGTKTIDNPLKLENIHDLENKPGKSPKTSNKQTAETKTSSPVEKVTVVNGSKSLVDENKNDGNNKNLPKENKGSKNLEKPLLNLLNNSTSLQPDPQLGKTLPGSSKTVSNPKPESKQSKDGNSIDKVELPDTNKKDQLLPQDLPPPPPAVAAATTTVGSNSGSSKTSNTVAKGIANNSPKEAKDQILNPIDKPIKQDTDKTSTLAEATEKTVKPELKDDVSVKKDKELTNADNDSKYDQPNSDENDISLGKFDTNAEGNGNNLDDNAEEDEIAGADGKGDDNTQAQVLPNKGGVMEKFEYADSHFFTYFLTVVGFCIIVYLVFHNKQKIIGFIVEGRDNRRKRPNTTNYRRLDSNLEAVMQNNTKTTSSSHVIF